MSFSVCRHACQRFVERCAPTLTLHEARLAIRSHARAIDCALDLGCKVVRLNGHARLILDIRHRQVVTVYPAPPKLKRCSPGVAMRATKRKLEHGEYW